MARTNLPLTTLAPNSSIAGPAGTNVDVTNGMTIALPSTAIPASPDSDTLFLVVNNTAAAAKAVTVRAGVGGGATPGPAFRSGIGDLAVSVGAGATRWIGPLESARFAQLDGSINVDFEAGTTGTIIAAILPVRGW